MKERFPGIFLLAAVFVIAICGLVYELVAAALSSYLLGGSVTQFSVVIGVFLTAMGLGSYLSRFCRNNLPDWFLGIQTGIGLSGGFSAAILLFTFAVIPSYLPVLIGVLTITGTLVGMEIPLLIRVLQSQTALRITVSNVLALDYLGALIASCLFPLVFVPYVGLLRTAFLFGLINVAVVGVGLRVLGPMLHRRKQLAVAAGASGVLLTGGFLGSGALTSITETILYQDDIILAEQTRYQRIVVTLRRGDLRLYIDGALQFSSVDEHRYHEALVHPAMAASPGARRVLILGGGDGMAAREVLKYSRIESIDLVDLDAKIIRIFRDRPLLANLSQRALSHPKMQVHIEDAGKFLERSTESWDLILLDLPDPNHLSLARLYTTGFYKLLSKHLNPGGIAVTQATSPYYAPEAFWCIVQTWSDAMIGSEGNERFSVYPYHAYIPSFGDWGFVMATMRRIEPTKLVPEPTIPLRFISKALLPTLFIFPEDSRVTERVEPNRLDDQILVKYYRKAWRRFGP